MDKRKLYESIMASVAKQVKKALLNESYDDYESMSDESWLSRYLINSWDRLYIRSLFDPVQNYAVYGLSSKEDVEEQKEALQRNKAINRFRIVGNRNGYYILCFKYNIAKDTERQELIQKSKEERLERERLAKEKFENDVQTANTDEYAPTARDWMKMVGYMNGHSNPERVAKSCKDHNKVVARYIISRTLGWGEAAREFKSRIKELGILTDAELEAYTRKYATYNIPDDIAELISAYNEIDATGGLSSLNIENSEIFPENIKKYIHDCGNVLTYSIDLLNPVDVKKYNHRRHYTPYGYKYCEAKLARVIFTMIDGSELQLYYAYSRIGRTFFKYQPQTSVDYEDINKANGISALKELLN